MAQINLLKTQKTSSADPWRIVMSIMVKVLGLLLLILVLYYGYLLFQTSKQNKNIVVLQTKIASDRKELAGTADRDQLLTRQQQLLALQNLVKQHPYWSALLPVLQAATLKSSSYTQLQALQDGTLTLSLRVPDTTELDKFLQVFDLPQFYKNFYNVHIGSIGRTQVGNTLMTSVEVRMQYNTDLLQYKAPTN